MARKSRAKVSPPEGPVVVDERCLECGHVGRAGTEVVPYAFVKGGPRAWLCWAGSGRKCLETSWGKHKAMLARLKEVSGQLAGASGDRQS